jgi:hypothetical protein
MYDRWHNAGSIGFIASEGGATAGFRLKCLGFSWMAVSSTAMTRGEFQFFHALFRGNGNARRLYFASVLG